MDTDTVTIACNMHSGIVMAAGGLPAVTLNGVATHARQTPDYQIVSLTVMGRAQRFALTKGVPRELWDAWAKQYATSSMIQSRSVFLFQDRPITTLHPERTTKHA